MKTMAAAATACRVRETRLKRTARPRRQCSVLRLRGRRKCGRGDGDANGGDANGGDANGGDANGGDANGGGADGGGAVAEKRAAASDGRRRPSPSNPMLPITPKCAHALSPQTRLAGVPVRDSSVVVRAHD